MKEKIVLFWFRRDLRLDDNHGLFEALKSGYKVLPLFIFDEAILDKLENKSDARVSFIHSRIHALNKQLQAYGSGIKVFKANPETAFKELIKSYSIEAVYLNKDYEPYALHRDKAIGAICKENGIGFNTFKDQVIFEEYEVVKDDGTPYTVFTPYSKKWKNALSANPIIHYQMEKPEEKYLAFSGKIPDLAQLGFTPSEIAIPEAHIDESRLQSYAQNRNIPEKDATTRVGVHLRFGTISIRKLVTMALPNSENFLNELIWREFFMQILYHFPKVQEGNFRSKYNLIHWRNNEAEFKRWCEGKTGYPMVDAGMRELNQTGFMHNRVRMITASFLTKHLLIDWRWGESYFASKLLDYELASNNGNWQWAAGTGCDAAPYFRVFNPTEQQKKFDPKGRYIKKWIPEIEAASYPNPMVDHKLARLRALETYKTALNSIN
ncbi:MAG: DNA photolyase family protein [Bacteroidetes bacterium]|nr:DNA photolyase family protein [Bacteroidota bacterium]MBU1580283.1 DNA photolyase family protein [Bacteroidota bacterium]MBU2556557.1 DNA photolyase family protein [Bacteroidota bacterium]